MKEYRISVAGLVLCLVCAGMLVLFWLLAGRLARADMGSVWFRSVGTGVAAFVLSLLVPVFGKIVVDEEGIHLRRLVRGRTIRWSEVRGWRRCAGGESTDVLRLQLADGSKRTLSPWYVYGQRVDEMEGLLRAHVLPGVHHDEDRPTVVLA